MGFRSIRSARVFCQCRENYGEYAFLNMATVNINYFLSFDYLFLAVLGLPCCTGLALVAVWASHRSGFICCRAWALGHTSFSSCNTWVQSSWLLGARAQGQQLRHTGLVTPRQMGPSWLRDQTRVSYVGGKILYH